MMAQALTITGLGALISTLSGASIGDSGQKGMEEAASHLESEIKSRAPVDTGNLRDSYAHTVESSGNTITAHVGTNVEYAIGQEYGTTYQGGTPHVRPALEANRSRLVEMMAEGTLTTAFEL